MRLLALIIVLGSNPALLSAQELEPRAYSPAPIGTKFLIAGFGGSKGSILLDPSLDVSDVLSGQIVHGSELYGRSSLRGNSLRLERTGNVRSVDT